jgi:hypothetical protein
MAQEDLGRTETKVREHFGDALLGVKRFRGELTLTVETSKCAGSSAMIRR